MAPYPFFMGFAYHETNTDFDFNPIYEFNHLFLVFSFIWTYILGRWYLRNSRYMNARAYWVSTLNGCVADFSFAMKCLMKEIPLTIQTASMAVSIFFSGFCLWVFERPLKDAAGQDFTYSNSFWNSVVTMTTVGYGDFYPKTQWGRFIGILVCFWGVLIVSIFVVSLTNLLTLSPAEEKTYSLLLRLRSKKNLKRHATFVL